MAAKCMIIRDIRNGDFLWMTKAALQLISCTLGAKGVAVYSWLCNYANSEYQNCFPSINTLAKKCQVSRRSVIRILKVLEELKALKIDRTTGKTNIYKLLKVSRLVPVSPETLVKESKATSATRDTGDKTDTRPVPPETLVPVPPEHHEQELLYQELINNKAGDPAAFKKLPYPEPSKEELELLNKLTKQIKPKFDVYVFMSRVRKIKGYPPPPKVMITACMSFLNVNGKVNEPWGWFVKVVREESGDFFADLNIRESEQLKKQPATIREILAKTEGVER